MRGFNHTVITAGGEGRGEPGRGPRWGESGPKRKRWGQDSCCHLNSCLFLRLPGEPGWSPLAELSGMGTPPEVGGAWGVLGVGAPGPETLVPWEKSIQRQGFGNTRGREVGWSPRASLLGAKAKQGGSCHGDREASDGGTLTILSAPGVPGPTLATPGLGQGECVCSTGLPPLSAQKVLPVRSFC